MFKRCLPLVALLATLLFSDHAGAQGVTASYENGLVSIQCDNASLASVFAKLEEVAGVQLILEDAVKNKRLTANLQGVPVAMAVQRLLDGNGVNYAVMMDPRDWGRVASIFVGTGGGGPSRSALPPQRPPVEPDPADEYDDFNDAQMLEDENFDDMNDPNGDLVDDPNAQFEDAPQDFAPPGSSPVPSYLPPQQSFPRSRFAPGAPSYQTPGSSQQQQQQQQQSEPPPPATMPFMDALGRPIPVPPEMNQQQQRRRQQQQQQQQ